MNVFMSDILKCQLLSILQWNCSPNETLYFSSFFDSVD